MTRQCGCVCSVFVLRMYIYKPLWLLVELLLILPSGDLLRYLENKVQEFEESHFCGICMERKRDVAFLCGHGACSHCAETLRTCHMCRKTILKKINLY